MTRSSDRPRPRRSRLAQQWRGTIHDKYGPDVREGHIGGRDRPRRDHGRCGPRAKLWRRKAAAVVL